MTAAAKLCEGCGTRCAPLFQPQPRMIFTVTTGECACPLCLGRRPEDHGTPDPYGVIAESTPPAHLPIPAPAANPTPQVMKSMPEKQEREDAKAGTQAGIEIAPEIMEGALAKVRTQEQEASGLAHDALAVPERALTVEAIERMADIAIARVKAFERVKAAILREGHHYVIACRTHPAQPKDERTGRRAPYVNHAKRPGAEGCGEGQVMMKKAGADTLGNGLGVSVSLLSDRIEPDKDGAPVKAIVEVRAEWQGTQRFGRGTATMSEILGDRTEHNLHEKAQTRAEKRAILAVLGSADPIADAEGISWAGPRKRREQERAATTRRNPRGRKPQAARAR